MNEPKHGDGPWSAGAIEDHIVDAHGHYIAFVIGTGTDEETAAIQRRIIATPDLLSACEHAEKQFPAYSGYVDPLGVQLRAAIAKAKAKTN